MCEVPADISDDMVVVVRQVVESKCEEVRRESVGCPEYRDTGVSLVVSVHSQSILQTMEVSISSKGYTQAPPYPKECI